jgi:uncharacterized membrane protein YeaQ/YmgE (transglycosylase-associated protein family)
MLTFIVMLIVVGLIAGAIARLLMPGRDPIGLLGTILLGVVGFLRRGFLENLLFYHTLATHRLHSRASSARSSARSWSCFWCALPGTSAAAPAPLPGADLIA